MKNWIISIAIILALGIASLGYWVGKINNEIVTLKSENAALNGSISALPKGPSQANSPTPVVITPTPVVTSPTATTGNAMVNLIPQIEPYIVRIDVTGAGFQAGGSGLIIRNDGYIITNAHVIENGTKIMVTLKGGQQHTATVNSSDAKIDLAILKLSGSSLNLPTATLGAINDIVIGVSVIAGGFPLGTDLPGPATFSRGIVSAIRTVDGQKYAQTDANINPGNSGGGLFTLDGKLIGITSSAILPRGLDVDGIGLCIPVDTLQTYIQGNLK